MSRRRPVQVTRSWRRMPSCTAPSFSTAARRAGVDRVDLELHPARAASKAWPISSRLAAGLTGPPRTSGRVVGAADLQRRRWPGRCRGSWRCPGSGRPPPPRSPSGRRAVRRRAAPSWRRMLAGHRIGIELVPGRRDRRRRRAEVLAVRLAHRLQPHEAVLQHPGSSCIQPLRVKKFASRPLHAAGERYLSLARSWAFPPYDFTRRALKVPVFFCRSRPARSS